MNPSSESLRLTDCLLPEWPAPAHVRSCVTTRAGGVSLPPFDSLNLGTHVGDDAEAVAQNRQRLQALLGCRPTWLNQVHSADVVEATPAQVLTADASWTATPGVAALVMTADCLPVLFCDRAGTRVAAAHAGWRGLAGGVLENTLKALTFKGKAFSRPLAILHRKGRVLTPAMRRFIDALTAPLPVQPSS